jgi:HK97 family phage portal protein
MPSVREFLAEAIGGKAYGRDNYGAPPEIYPSPRTKVANRDAKTHVQAYGGDQAIDWVHDCVRLITETASNAPFYCEKNGVKLVAPDAPPTEKGEKAPSDLWGLLLEPNPYMDYVEFIELSLIDLLLAGEFIWYEHEKGDDGKPLALYRLNPALVQIVADPHKFIKQYEYTPPGASVPQVYKPEQIIHAKMPNPHNPYRGLGVVAGGPRVFDVELALTESLAQYYEQGTKLTGVLSSERRVPTPVFERIRRQFSNLYSGARNAYKVAVLENGLKFTGIQSNATEAGYVDVENLSRDRICYMFRVPKPLIGDFSEPNLKIADAQRIFDTKTMRPLLDKIEKVVSRGLTEAWGVDFKIDYHYVMPSEDRLKLAAQLSSLPVKVRELREQAGLDPSTGDVKLDETVLNDPTKLPVMPAGGEGGRPPLPDHVPARTPGAGQPRMRGTYPTAQARNRERVSQVKAMEDVQALIDPLYSARRPTVELLAANLQRELGSLSRDLEKDLERAVRGDQRGAADVLKRLKAARGWRVFTARATEAMMRFATEAMQTARNQHRLIGFDPDALPDLQLIAAQLVNRENGIKSIVGTMKESVSRVVADGLAKGFTPEQIVAGVPGEDFPGLRMHMIDWRRGQAETIAKTEAQEYYNEGAIRVAEATEHTHVLVTDGEDFDEPCVQANGQVWPLDYAREHRTEHPRCTRTFYPMAIGAEAGLAAEGKALDPAGTTLAPNITLDLPAITLGDIVVDIPAPDPAQVRVDVAAPEAKPTRRRLTYAEDGTLTGSEEVPADD